MPSVHLYIHVVFAVKKRMPRLEPGKRELLFEHMVDNAKDKKIDILSISGAEDHLHMLIRLQPVQSVSHVLQLIKGESSRWSNEMNLFSGQLVWAKGYYARSIDPGEVGIVKHYIAGQEKHASKFRYIFEYMNSVTL